MYFQVGYVVLCRSFKTCTVLNIFNIAVQYVNARQRKRARKRGFSLPIFSMRLSSLSVGRALPSGFCLSL